MMSQSRKEIIRKCRLKLEELKSKYERSLRRPRLLREGDKDIIDRAASEVEIQNSLYFRGRYEQLMPEIELALRKLRLGTYGICESTGELIDEKRLLAVPWTRIKRQLSESA
jgi:DnaK suppressor protein